MPGHPDIDSSPRRAPLSMQIAVVGANIAGLAAAYTLQRAGHVVTVLEQGDGRTRGPGGVRSPPNMTRLLNQWGLGPALERLGHRCTRFMFLTGDSGEPIGAMKLHEQFLGQLMADFMFVGHADLQSLLYELARQEGVRFRFHARVTRVDTVGVAVTLESGERLVSDMIVGADGFDSVVRTAVLGYRVAEMREKVVCLMFTVPTAAMREEEDLCPFTETTDWQIWLGDHSLVHGFLINSGCDFSMVLQHPIDHDFPELNQGWSDTYPLEHFNIDISKFEPRVRKLLGLTKRFTAMIDIKRPHLESFVCDTARVVVIGEAAHPMMVTGQQATALGIEDAQTLGSLFAQIQDRAQVPQLLAAYEELRQGRCHLALEWERRKRAMLVMPRGAEQERRDAGLRMAMAYGEWDCMDEESFMEIWGEEMDLLDFNAAEVVEDWWTKWGALLVRGGPAGAEGLAPSLRVEISRDG